MSSQGRLKSAREERGARYQPHELLFPIAVLASVLPALPPIAALSGFIGIPLQAPAAALWIVVAMILGSALQGALLAVVLACIGAVSTLQTESAELMRAWFGVLLLPLALFVGLQAVDGTELKRARESVRWILIIACSAQVFYYVTAAGLASLTSPSAVYVNHTNIEFWEQAGQRVLANPNNAAVIFCTAFAWSVAERAAGVPGRLSPAFVLVSATSVYLTGSRGAWLAAGAIVLLAALVHVRSRARVAMLLVLAVGLYIAVNAWLARFADVARTGDTASIRLQTRAVTVDEVLGTPLGHGVGTTADVLRERLGVVGFISSDTAGATSHDLFLNWGVCVGWVGLLLLLVLIGTSVRRGILSGGLLTIMPLVGYVLSGELVGLDVLNSTNAAWSTMLLVLIGLGWRGGIVFGGLSLPESSEVPDRVIPARRGRGWATYRPVIRL